jgi:hypothetical protein
LRPSPHQKKLILKEKDSNLVANTDYYRLNANYINPFACTIKRLRAERLLDKSLNVTVNKLDAEHLI